MAAISMHRVVVDVETIGYEWDALTDEERAYLMDRAAPVPHDDLESREWNAKRTLALNPLTAQVVAIGMLNPDTNRGRIHLWTETVVPGVHAPEAFDTPGCEVTAHGSEADALQAFWRDLAAYVQVITFNGRAFDGPMLALRSLVQGVRVSRNLIGNRYDRRHLDLKEVLRTPFSLDFLCRRLGIPSPKEHGSGKDVERLWRERRFQDLCAYLTGDLHATAAVLAKAVAANLVEGSDRSDAPNVPSGDHR